MTNKIKRLVSILLVTLLFVLSVQPAFAANNKRTIDDYSVEELLTLSDSEQESLGFYVLAEVPVHIPVSNKTGSKLVSYIDGTWRVLYTKANGLGFYMSGTTVGIGPDVEQIITLAIPIISSEAVLSQQRHWCQLKASTTLHIHTIFMMLEPISTVVLVAISE